MSTSAPRDLADLVAYLHQKGAAVTQQAPLDGHRVDFYAAMPSGLSVVLAWKEWLEVDAMKLQKAEAEARYLARLSNVAAAFVVIPSLPDSQQTASVRNGGGVLESLAKFCEPSRHFNFRSVASVDKAADSTAKIRKVFIAMPFDESMEDVYFLGIVPAVHAVGAVCVRMDQDQLTGNIIIGIQKEIREASAVVADVTGANPNVAYELGFAHAIGVPTLHISATALNKLPFDIRQWSTLLYVPGQIHRLQQQLPGKLRLMLPT